MKKNLFKTFSFVSVILFTSFPIYLGFGQDKIFNPKEDQDVEYIGPSVDGDAYGDPEDFSHITLKANGDLNVWGVNNYGQLGTGTADFILEENATTIYTETDGWLFIDTSEENDYSGVDKLTIDYEVTTVLMNDGNIYSFGENYFNEFGIGDDTTVIHHTPILIYDATTDIAAPTWDEEVDNTGFVNHEKNSKQSNISPSRGYHGKPVNVSSFNYSSSIIFQDGAQFSTSTNSDDNYYLQINDDDFLISSNSFSVVDIKQSGNIVSEIDFEIDGMLGSYDARNLDTSITMIDDQGNIADYNLEFTGYDQDNYSKKYYKLETNTNGNGGLVSNTDYEISSITFSDETSGSDYIIDIADNTSSYDINDGFHFRTDYVVADIASVEQTDITMNSFNLIVHYNEKNNTDPYTIQIYSYLLIDGVGQKIKLTYTDVTEIDANTYSYEIKGLSSGMEYDQIEIYAPTNEYATEETMIFEDSGFELITSTVNNTKPAFIMILIIIAFIIISLIVYLSYYFFYYQRKLKQYYMMQKQIADVSLKFIDESSLEKKMKELTEENKLDKFFAKKDGTDDEEINFF